MAPNQSSSKTENDSKAENDLGEYKYRLVLLGEAAVGKTSLLRRYTENTFNPDYKQTIGTTFAAKDVAIENNEGETTEVRLVIWDMGGQSTYRELRRQYMKGAAGGIIVYDVTRPETFMAMNNWFESFRDICPNSPVVICANKIDLKEERMVPVEPGIMLRDWFQADYYETSAKTGEAVDSAFRRVAKILVDRLKSGKEPKM
ncbi:MAG: GTP-binding protein [Candidatus Thorarchaeota archaeon]|nr:GTP-binding protein [Candidatus Thorarchaeota archaeon]